MKKIFFDMDGTVYDLYNLPNWLEMLRNEEDGAFALGNPKVNLQDLAVVCQALQMQGWQIGVITWLPMNATQEYQIRAAREKKNWIAQNMPYVTEFYAQAYGVPKQIAPVHQAKTMILVDDNADVRKTWETKKQRKTIDANLDIIAELAKLLEE